MALLYGRAGRLTAQNGIFRPGQCASEGACGDSSGFVADGLGVDGAIGVFWADINPVRRIVTARPLAPP